MRRCLALLLLLPLLGVVAPSTAVAQEQQQNVLSGAIDGTDGRAVNALIGFDFLDAQGRRLDRNGCVQSPECPVVGYASVLRVNKTLSAEGSPDRNAWATTWTMPMPEATAQVFIEAYPQNPNLRTDETRYGHAMRHGVKVPTNGPVDIHLPLVLCNEGGTVGSIAGTASHQGSPVPVKRVVAWSLDEYDAVSRPVVGWNIGTARSDGTFHVPNLASAQRYQVWVTAEDGTVRKTFGVPVEACKETTMSVAFDPDPAPEPPSAPTIDPGQEVVTVGQSSTLTGAAEPGQQVELWAYSRPSTQFRLVRTTTAEAGTGRYVFSVTPPTDTRLRVRVRGMDSPSVVVGVRSVVRLAVTRLAPRVYRFSGTVFPRRAGQPFAVYLGSTLVSRTVVGSDGRWTVDRRFLGTGTFDVTARTRSDGINRAATSNVVPTQIR